MEGDCLVTYWEDKLTGLIEMGKHARKLFNRDIDQVYVGGKNADYRRLIEWIIETQKTLNFFQYIKHEKTLDEDLDYMLGDLKCTGYLSLEATPSENYRPAKPPVFNLYKLYIRTSFWFEQRDLVAMNCKIVTMEGSKLTSHDFNVFLKHWMTGGCSKLKLLHVSVQEPIDYEVVFDGVEFTERGDDVERIYFYMCSIPDTLKGGLDVKRSNVTATVADRYAYRFMMIVW